MSDNPLLEEKTISQLKGLGVSFASVVEDFRVDISDRIKKLTLAIDEKDIEGAQSLLHSMKGASLTLGARKLSNICSTLENFAKRGDLNQLGQGMDNLSLQFAETVTALRTEFGSA